MSIRKAVAVAGLIAFGAVPLTSQASGPDTAVKSCVQTFIDTYLKDRTVRSTVQIPAPTPLRPQHSYTVDLSAHGAQSGDLVAQARCTANARGKVTVLDSVDAGTYLAAADFTVSLK